MDKLGFKSDREFLRNISIGAVGTRQVARLLTEGGFRIIELERYAMSNKIWANKLKRLRVPDLLCLKSGIRVESRAKSTLKITMSHALDNPERAWDKGLRDSDLIAFVRCSYQGNAWVASERMMLFRAGEMRQTAELAGLGKPKAPSEGSERQLTWPATIPSKSGQVISVTSDNIKTRFDSGRPQIFRLQRDKGRYRLYPYVSAGDTFGPEDTIIASVMPNTVPAVCPVGPQYNFLADLDSEEGETAYAAVKALGFLPEFIEQSVPRLLHIMENHVDHRIRLEAASSLARLNIEEGWTRIGEIGASEQHPIELRMEAALILAEFQRDEALSILGDLARNSSNPPELRAAGAWGMASEPRDLRRTSLLELMSVEDDDTAVHAIVAASRLLTEGTVGFALDQIGRSEKQSAGIVRAIVASGYTPLERIVEKIRAAGPTATEYPWLIYLLASLGRKTCEPCLLENAPELLTDLQFFWTYHQDNWTNRLDVADQIDFLIGQFPD